MTVVGSDAAFRVSQVSTVPVFWADLPGPTRAALMFDVGWADETLPQHGITHMFEHLAFASLGRSEHACNGATADTVTSFSVQGTVDETTAYLSAISRGLANPDTSRLDEEKRILRIEKSRRSTGVISSMRIWRHGAAGPGLASYDEFARFYTEGQHLAFWSSKYFTAGNAVVVMTSPPPLDWQLHLNPGIPHRRDPWRSALPTLPARVVEPINGVALSMLVPRGAVCSALQYVLYHRLMNRLRFQDALTYGVDVESSPLDASTSELFVLADGLPEHQAGLERGLLATLAEVRTNGPTEEEIATWFAGYREGIESEGMREELLFAAARDHVQGRRARQPHEWIAEAAAVRSADVQRVLAEASQTVIAATPGTPAAPITVSLREAISPFVMRIAPPGPAPKKPKQNVSANPDSVTLENATHRLTVPWAECAAVLRWYDGGRTIIASDGSSFSLRPSEWDDLDSVVAVMDQFTPIDSVIWTGEPIEEPAAVPEKGRGRRRRR